MDRRLLLRIWWLLAFGLTGLLSLLVFLWGGWTTFQPRVEVEAVAHQDYSDSRSCVFYFTYTSEGQSWRSEPENVRTRAGCPFVDGETETIYHKPGEPLEFVRHSRGVGIGVTLMFGLVAASCPVAIRKKWSELDPTQKA